MVTLPPSRVRDPVAPRLPKNIHEENSRASLPPAHSHFRVVIGSLPTKSSLLQPFTVTIFICSRWLAPAAPLPPEGGRTPRGPNPTFFFWVGIKNDRFSAISPKICRVVRFGWRCLGS